MSKSFISGVLMVYILCYTQYGIAQNIMITNQQHTEQYWVAFFVTNEDLSCGGSISNVEITDNNYYNNEWISYSDNQYGYYSFDDNGNDPYTVPLTLRISKTKNGIIQSIVKHDVITSFTGDAVFDFGTNFCSSTNQPSSTDQPLSTSTNTVSSTSSSNSNYSVGTTQKCVAAIPSNLVWTSKNHKIHLNGDIISIKGIAWFGTEGDGYVPGGLATWYGNGGHSYLWYFDLIQSLGFNAIRLPFSQYGVENNPLIPSWAIDTAGNEIFNGKNNLDALDIIIDEAASRGILIMLDFHSIYNTGGGQDLFYDPNNGGIALWNTMANRYKDRWNIFMIDLFNEPYDVTNSQWTEYKNWCETVGNNVINTYNVNWLIAAQGTNTECYIRNYDSSNGYYCFWGENLQKVDIEPITLNTPNRIVYIPHVYGPSITEYNGNYDPVPYGNNIWDDHWGYIVNSNVVDSALMIGEWGSTYSTNTRINWMNSFIHYLISIDNRDNFFWCLNENSVDTGGILKSDWTTIDQAKMAKLDELQPNPTMFSYDSNTNSVCWNVPKSSQTESTTTTTQSPQTSTGSASTASGTTAATQSTDAVTTTKAVTTTQSAAVTTSTTEATTKAATTTKTAATSTTDATTTTEAATTSRTDAATTTKTQTASTTKTVTTAKATTSTEAATTSTTDVTTSRTQAATTEAPVTTGSPQSSQSTTTKTATGSGAGTTSIGASSETSTSGTTSNCNGDNECENDNECHPKKCVGTDLDHNVCGKCELDTTAIANQYEIIVGIAFVMIMFLSI